MKVVFYREADGTVPILEWLETLPRLAVVKCRVKIDRLKELGHENCVGLRRTTFATACTS